MPKNITDELKKLLDRLPEVPFESIKEIIEASLNASLDELFFDVEQEPLGSASIAQTHLAITKEGETVVLKVIKPGIREAILADIKLLQILADFLEQVFNQPTHDNPFLRLRSGLMAAACIIGGVIAMVGGAHPVLWIGLFVSSVVCFFFGK